MVKKITHKFTNLTVFTKDNTSCYYYDVLYYSKLFMTFTSQFGSCCFQCHFDSCVDRTSFSAKLTTSWTAAKVSSASQSPFASMTKMLLSTTHDSIMSRSSHQKINFSLMSRIAWSNNYQSPSLAVCMIMPVAKKISPRLLPSTKCWGWPTWPNCKSSYPALHMVAADANHIHVQSTSGIHLTQWPVNLDVCFSQIFSQNIFSLYKLM